jgi:hypothetical protein
MTRIRFLLCISLLAVRVSAAAQDAVPSPSPSPSPQAVPATVAPSSNPANDTTTKETDPFKVFFGPSLARAKKTPVQAANFLLNSVNPYVEYLATESKPFFFDLEANRLDKETGNGAQSNGSTSAVNKASVPWLFGFAVEHGALTQSVSGNVITFRGNVANAIKAFVAKDYLKSYQLGSDDPFMKYVFGKISFGVSLNAPQSTSTSASTSTTANNPSQLAGFSVHYDIRNHRDPRDPYNRARWAAFVQKNGTEFSNKMLDFIENVQKLPEYKAWRDETAEAIKAALEGGQPDALDNTMRERLEEFKRKFQKQLQPAVDKAVASMETYTNAKSAVLNAISTSTVVSLDYSFVKQSNAIPDGTTMANNAPVTQGAIPDLSTVTLIVDAPFIKRADLTANGSFTLFNSTPGGSTLGSIRDYRLSGQADMHLPEIQNIGSPTLTFSGVFLSLLEEPLGQIVKVNDVTISRTGNIGLFQSKLTIPVKGSGIKIPISFTYSNRTELIKEKDVRGSIGFTLDLDSIFSKPQ